MLLSVVIFALLRNSSRFGVVRVVIMTMRVLHLSLTLLDNTSWLRMVRVRVMAMRVFCHIIIITLRRRLDWSTRVQRNRHMPRRLDLGMRVCRERLNWLSYHQSTLLRRHRRGKSDSRNGREGTEDLRGLHGRQVLARRNLMKERINQSKRVWRKKECGEERRGERAW